MKFENISGGSERIFLRFEGKGNFIIIKDNPDSPDFISYLKIQKFLYKKELGVPEIYYKDLKNGILIVEDLGKNSLERCPYEKNYKKVIDFLCRMQIEGKRGFLNLKLPYKKIFDREKLLKETEYFNNFYLKKYRKNKGDEKLEKAFIFLARKISEIPYFFMHRDFQSKNIFIKNGKIRITDFQTAHIGPFTYDLASLLFDPYVNLDERILKGLSQYYYKKMKNYIKMDFEDYDFFLKITGIQRLCQALAAFVNLSKFKNKREFEKYIPHAEKRIKYLLERMNIKELNSLKDIFL